VAVMDLRGYPPRRREFMDPDTLVRTLAGRRASESSFAPAGRNLPEALTHFQRVPEGLGAHRM
jgi:hypothetical protein